MEACIYCSEASVVLKESACPKCLAIVIPKASIEQAEVELNCAMIASMVTAKFLGCTGESVREAARHTLAVIKPIWGIL